MKKEFVPSQYGQPAPPNQYGQPAPPNQYGAPMSAPGYGQPSPPNPGYGQQAPPASYGQPSPPGGGYAQPGQPMNYGPPGVVYTQPGQAGQTNYGQQTPPSYNQPGPPSYNQPGPPASFAPPGQSPNMPPGQYPPTNAGPSAMPQAPKSSVQFFSMAGGTPTPSAALPSGPPGFGGGSGGGGGGMGPPGSFPPSSQFGGGMPPPPSGMGMPSGSGSGGMPPPPGAGAGFYPQQGDFGMGGQQQQQQQQMGYSIPGPPGSQPGMNHGGMSQTFDSVGNLATMAGGSPRDGGAGGGGGQGNDGNLGGANSLPALNELDLSIQCDPSFLRATIGRMHQNQAAGQASRIPIGLICRPMAGDKGINNDKIEVVDFGSTGIVRCKRCRTYINPYVSWLDNGRRWRCNICGMLNEVPTSYFSHLDNNGQRRDKDQRPELSRCSVEFVAPGDYMVRPPQPPVYFFVIDVSSVSVQSGMLNSMVAAIKDSLDELPGNTRTMIGFITFDSSIHFYNLKSTLAAPQMLVVSDVVDVILPLPEDLLVNLQESRAIVDALLDSLPNMFASSSTINTCTGPALLAARRVMQHVGGKLCLFQSSLPSVGEGALKSRDNPRLLGTDKEHTLLNVEDPWYKNTAIEFSRLQIAVDTFLFSGQYTDLATISVLSKYSSGSTYYYPAFYGQRDGPKFEHELRHCLTRATAFEAVMRVRATRGVRITNFYGNYFIRGTDLLSLPNCTSDTTFSLDLAYEETSLSAQAISVQAALLYTTSSGERRIRIHTLLLPVTTSMPEVIDTVDIDAVVNMLAKQAVDIAQKTGMENARQRVHQITVEIMRASRQTVPQGMMGGPGQYQQQQQHASADAPVPLTLQLLPLYSMAIQKSLVLRGGAEVRVDERAFYQQLMHNMDIDESKVFIYPRMFSIRDMSDDAGVPVDQGEEDVPTAGPFRIRLPAILNLSCERLASDGMFLMENGFDFFLWIGRSVSPSILSTLFGVSSLEGVDISQLAIQSENSDFSSRLNAIIVALRQDRARYMHLHFIREGDGHAEAYFARYLVEDRAHFPGGAMSYTEYHGYVTRQLAGLPG